MCASKRGGGVIALAAALAVLATGPAVASIAPDPYGTLTGTGSIRLVSTLGSSSCLLRSVDVDATGTGTGAAGTVDGFIAYGCTGIVTSGVWIASSPFSVSSGAVGISFSMLKTNILGGRCLLSGTLTGAMPNGGDTFTVNGTLTLAGRLTGICEGAGSAQLTLTLPGAAIGW